MGKNDKFDDGFSEMLPTPPSAGIGHNRPPESLPVGADLETRLQKAHKESLDRAEELRSKAGSFRKVETQNDLKRATEYVRQLQAAMTALSGAIDLERAPYRVALGQVGGVLGEPHDAIEAIKKATEALMTTYNQKVLREERRKREADLAKKRADEETARALQRAKEAAAQKLRDAAQKKIDEAAAAAAQAAKPKAEPPKAVVRAIAKADEAQRQANEARDIVDDHRAEVTRAERAVKAPAAEITRQRSPNAVQSAQEFVDFREFNKDMIDLERLRSFLGTDHIQTAIRAYIASNNASIKDDIRNRRQPLKGVEFFINQRTRVGG